MIYAVGSTIGIWCKSFSIIISARESSIFRFGSRTSIVTNKIIL